LLDQVPELGVIRVLVCPRRADRLVRVKRQDEIAAMGEVGPAERPHGLEVEEPVLAADLERATRPALISALLAPYRRPGTGGDDGRTVFHGA
jgi:hypothetical protein